jgi:4-hydroxybenzoate polyprenyltransferase
MNQPQTNMSQGHTDIELLGWWQNLPKAWHPYVYLARLDRPIGWWLLLLPAWWVIPLASADSGQMGWLMLLFTIGAITMRAAGCVINDMWDRDIDIKVERTQSRPLAAGTVSMGKAFIFLVCLGVIGLAVLVQLPPMAIFIGIGSLPLVALYPLAKRVTWFPQFVLGLTFAWGVPLGVAAATNQAPSPAFWLIYAGSVAWVFGYDTIYAVQDMVDDRQSGVRSSALGLGQNLHKGVGFAYALAILLLSTGFYVVMGFGLWFAGVSLMALHLVHQLRQLDADDPVMALRLFKSNRNAGLILTAFAVADHMLGVGL